MVLVHRSHATQEQDDQGSLDKMSSLINVAALREPPFPLFVQFAEMAS